MSLTSSQRFKARLSWRISKNSLLPIENNVKHDMAENWDWDATRLVFWLKSLLTLIHVEAISTVEDSAHAHFRKLETWSCNFEMSSRLPRRWKVLHRVINLEQLSGLEEGELPPLEAAWGPVMISFKWSATPAAPDVPWDRSKTS
jgi:hypothetical protein